MFSFLKKFVRFGVVSGVVLATTGAAAVMIAGPHRAKAVVDKVHTEVLTSIDQHIDDPSALRAQLQEMEREYPKRISQVRGDLAEINEQIRQLQHEQQISERVVELAEADLADVEVKLSQASFSGEGGMRLASVSMEERVGLQRARTRAQQIQNTRVSYANRAADAAHDLAYLSQQAARLEELLVQLENERAQFKSQILSLSRQVDAIARNERLIHLVEKRNKTIQDCSRYEAVSLDQITGRLAEIRSRQEAELDLLAQGQEQTAYEDLARMQLATEDLEGRVMGADKAAIELSPYASELSVSNN